MRISKAELISLRTIVICKVETDHAVITLADLDLSLKKKKLLVHCSSNWSHEQLKLRSIDPVIYRKSHWRSVHQPPLSVSTTHPEQWI